MNHQLKYLLDLLKHAKEEMVRMKVIDTHCDALLKLQQGMRQGLTLNYRNEQTIETNLNRLRKGNVKIQFYAIFIDPEIPSDEKWQHALEQIDLFYSEIIGKNPDIKQIKNWEDIAKLKEREIGAVLTLEGADAFGNSLVKLRHLYRMGVLSIGLTWNNANLCADGVGEPRGSGLTLLGKEVVKLNNENRIWTDVSHLSVNSFWDVMELADYPFASHSNARAICDHPRNLTNDQIEAMFNKNGLIQLVFNPPFINEQKQTATISDLITHIDHLCALGGEKQIGFGSDFDGITSFVKDLENASKYPVLINELLEHYSEEQVRGFAYENFIANLPK